MSKTATDSKIISLKDYKRKHDIPLPRSPYYNLNATQEELDQAYRLAEYSGSHDPGVRCFGNRHSGI